MLLLCCSVSGRPAGFSPAEGLADDDSDTGAIGASGGLSLLSHALADLSRVLGAKLEPFAIGPASTAIAKELATLPQAGSRRGLGQQQQGLDSSSDSPRAELGAAAAGGGAGGGGIGLVLIDRSVDLATPCMHSEHVLDIVLSCLERPAGMAVGPGGVQLRWVQGQPLQPQQAYSTAQRFQDSVNTLAPACRAPVDECLCSPACTVLRCTKEACRQAAWLGSKWTLGEFASRPMPL